MAEVGVKVTLLINGSIVTMDKELRVFLKNGAVAVVGDKIAAIGKTEEILSAYESKADEVQDLSSRWIIPGISFLAIVSALLQLHQPPLFLVLFILQSFVV